MKTSKILQFALLLLLIFNISCSTSEDEIILPKGAYENGIFILNEGNFGVPNASVTFASADLNTIEQNIFSTNNGNSNLGDVLQTIAYNGNFAYLVLNNSNKIVVVDRYTFKKVTEITNQISQPRFIAFANNNIYVTNDQYNGAKYVSVYKVSDLSFVKKIDLTDSVERIVEAGGNIFVQNASYGFGNKITYINTSSNVIQSVTTLPNGQINKTIVNNSNIYSIAAGSTDSYIYQISSAGTIVKTTTLSGIANATNLEIDGNKFYFSSDNKVYTMDMSATSAPTSPLFTVAANPYSALYGFNVIGGKIYTSDAKGFTEDSEVTVFSNTGSILKTFKAGRGTSGFYAN